MITNEVYHLNSQVFWVENSTYGLFKRDLAANDFKVFVGEEDVKICFEHREYFFDCKAYLWWVANMSEASTLTESKRATECRIQFYFIKEFPDHTLKLPFAQLIPKYSQSSEHCVDNLSTLIWNALIFTKFGFPWCQKSWGGICRTFVDGCFFQFGLIRFHSNVN